MKTIFTLLLQIPVLIMAQAPLDSSGFKSPKIAKHDSSTNLIFTCQKQPTKHFKSRITKIRNGEKITVWDTTREKIHGKLNVLNRDFFEITDRQGKKDTFSLGEVFEIKWNNPPKKTTAGILCTLGTTGMIGGAALANTPDAYSGAKYFPGLNLIGGALLVITSMPIEATGIFLFLGKTFQYKHYSFHIISN